MKPLEVLFRLLMLFVPIPEDEYRKIKEEGNEWYLELDETKGGILGTFKKFSSQWYGKVFWAIMYIVGQRQIKFYMNPELAGAAGDDNED